MKKIVLFTIISFLAKSSFAQIGINTTGASADGSAMLDISSTSKGMLIPRMTTMQRTGIGSPVKGLMVFDNETNSFWYYNGSNWINMAAGSGFTLPYTANVNLASPLFDMTNNGNGDIFYISSMGAGTGLNSFSVGGHSINTNSINGYGLRAASSTNYPIVGLSDNAANTLAAIRAFNIGGGPGLHASSTVDNGVFGTSAGTGKSGLRGEASATNGMGAYGLATNSTGIGVSGNNTAGGDGVLGTSTTGYGVRGVTNSATGFAGVHGTNNGTAGSGVVGISHIINTQGVYGSSNNGIGIRGASENFRAISGTANSGTALYGNSATGYALETVGKVKIAGGNTNPSDGAVLTSDATGNAVWKSNNSTPKIGFAAKLAANTSIPENTYRKLEFSNEEFDFQNNFVNYTGTTTPSTSVFTVPVSGVYNVSAMAGLLMGSITFNFDLGTIRIMNNSNVVAETRGLPYNDIGVSSLFMQINGSFHFNANDKIWIEIKHTNEDDSTQGCYNLNETERFSCILMHAD